jgi:hypothetical protein
LHHDLLVPEDRGDLHSDFEQVVTAALWAAEQTDAAHVVPRLLAESAHDPELQKLFYDNLVAPRRVVMRTLLDRAVERGEVRADVDLEMVMDLLVGPIVYRGLITGMNPAAMAQRARDVLDTVLLGISPR